MVDLDGDTLQIQNLINGFKGSVLPSMDFVNNGLCDYGNQAVGDCGAVHLPA